MRCSEVREMLPAYARPGDRPLEVRRHISRCAECRAEVRRYELLLEDLGAMSTVTAEPPPGLLESLAAIPSRMGRVATVTQHVSRHRTRYASGAALAAAGLVGAALWRSRSRRLAAA